MCLKGRCKNLCEFYESIDINIWFSWVTIWDTFVDKKSDLWLDILEIFTLLCINERERNENLFKGSNQASSMKYNIFNAGL